MLARANLVRSPIQKALAVAVAASIASGVQRRGTPLTLRGLADRFTEGARTDPMGALFTLVGGASVLFYVAERGRNPKVKTLTDAVLFISTCLSVGYADVFAKTEAGKAIAAFVMMLGPAMSSGALDEGRPREPGLIRPRER